MQSNQAENTIPNANDVQYYWGCLQNVNMLWNSRFSKTFDLSQQLIGEILQQQTAKMNEIRLDIWARAFRKAGQRTFFDEMFLKPNFIRYVEI